MEFASLVFIANTRLYMTSVSALYDGFSGSYFTSNLKYGSLMIGILRKEHKT